MTLKRSRIPFLFLLLFGVTLFFRLPTFFNDYYDVDELAAIVQTKEYLAGDIPGQDFSESKLPLYHAIFKLSYQLDPDQGWVFVHLITVLIIFLTACFIFLIERLIRRDSPDSFAFGGALIYVVLVSSFNRHFMATNGEIIYNLPVTASFYFLMIFLFQKQILKKFLYLLLCLLTAWIATQIKFHGNIIVCYLIFFFLIYYKYRNGQINLRYLFSLGSALLLFVFLILLGSYFENNFSLSVIKSIKDKIFYAFADKGFNPFIFLVKFFHRQGMLFLWHFVAWGLGIHLIINFFKNIGKGRGDENLVLSSLIILFLFNYLMIFGGGLRLYFHYFLAVYPSLSILAGLAFFPLSSSGFINCNNRLLFLLLIPGLFFWSWNTKDIIIKHFYPQAFYQEGKFFYWTRAVLVGSFNDYLLPEKSYLPVVEYIKNETKPGERIFVWGDGPYLYYFSERRMGGKTLWPKNSVLQIIRGYQQNTKESLKKVKDLENNFIRNLKKKKPVLFIDTSSSNLSNFNYSLEEAPLLKAFVLKNYFLETTVSKMKIYKLKSYVN